MSVLTKIQKRIDALRMMVWLDCLYNLKILKMKGPTMKGEMEIQLVEL